MKKTKGLLLTGTIVAVCCSIGHAQNQIIYSEDFTSGSAVSLQGLAPTYASDFAGGSSSATWNVLTNSGTAFMNQNGKDSAGANTALLPFTPQSGFVYTLAADITFTGNPGNWLEMGFAGHNPTSNTGSAKITDTTATGPDGLDWATFTAAGGNENLFGGPGTASPFVSGSLLEGTGEWIVTLTLDTETPQWTTSLSFNGLSGAAVGKSYSSSEFNLVSTSTNIIAVQYGQNSITAPDKVTWNSLQLTATPEPSTMALAGLGIGVLSLIFRKQKRS